MLYNVVLYVYVIVYFVRPSERQKLLVDRWQHGWLPCASWVVFSTSIRHWTRHHRCVTVTTWRHEWSAYPWSWRYVGLSLDWSTVVILTLSGLVAILNVGNVMWGKTSRDGPLILRCNTHHDWSKARHVTPSIFTFKVPQVLVKLSRMWIKNSPLVVS